MKRLVRFFQISCLAWLVAVWIGSIAIAPANAHWNNLAIADVIVTDTEAQITLSLPTTLIAFADDNNDQILSQLELDKHYSQLEQTLSRNIVLTDQAGNPGISIINPAVAARSQDKATHSTFTLQYQWTQPLQKLSIRYSLFSPELDQDQCLVTITQGNHTRNVIFTPENNTIDIVETLAWQQQVISFLQLGIEHIFTGYDHIFFLVALLLPGGNISQLLKIVLAFTVAHSLTLTVAGLNIITVPTALVESMIALSIVYVAAENLWKKQINHRPWLTFGFGLIHGLGFANILNALHQRPSNLLLSLASFNLGVELGQITIVVLVLCGLRFVQKYHGTLFLRYSMSVLMMLMGSVWFTERALAAWP